MKIEFKSFIMMNEVFEFCFKNPIISQEQINLNLYIAKKYRAIKTGITTITLKQNDEYFCQSLRKTDNRCLEKNSFLSFQILENKFIERYIISY